MALWQGHEPEVLSPLDLSMHILIQRNIQKQVAQQPNERRNWKLISQSYGRHIQSDIQTKTDWTEDMGAQCCSACNLNNKKE